MRQVQLISDLHIEGDDLKIDVTSNKEIISVTIEGPSIPKIHFPLKKSLSLMKSIPFNTAQEISVVYNKKEIYQSGKSLFYKYDFLFFLKTFLKNLF
ncbi:hypothetical protein [Belliella aquatica]|uniref:Uncharacterized protein n=1 Tax=Belliella aquatica TaxID=1323734 RepID=A0ABQ1N4W9_9BACT|nr:hypothetical protein [Belliella aquatica]MCH7407483.1 hypothetical protein [Belliella aquatica]GGC53962.1 hypothetical protein GCM10010993_35470 [Belliella aquatica]